jgi:hypothetical protein
MLQVYANCVYGEEQTSNERIERALMSAGKPQV